MKPFTVLDCTTIVKWTKRYPLFEHKVHHKLQSVVSVEKSYKIRGRFGRPCINIREVVLIHTQLKFMACTSGIKSDFQLSSLSSRDSQWSKQFREGEISFSVSRALPTRIIRSAYHASNYCIGDCNFIWSRSTPRWVKLFCCCCCFYPRREFFREIIYKNIAIIAIQHGKFDLLTPLAIFPVLLSEIHSSPSGKFPYTYQLKLPMWRVVITIQYGKNRHIVY